LSFSVNPGISFNFEGGVQSPQENEERQTKYGEPNDLFDLHFLFLFFVKVLNLRNKVDKLRADSEIRVKYVHYKYLI